MDTIQNSVFQFQEILEYIFRMVCQFDFSAKQLVPEVHKKLASLQQDGNVNYAQVYAFLLRRCRVKTFALGYPSAHVIAQLVESEFNASKYYFRTPVIVEGVQGHTWDCATLDMQTFFSHKFSDAENFRMFTDLEKPDFALRDSEILQDLEIPPNSEMETVVAYAQVSFDEATVRRAFANKPVKILNATATFYNLGEEVRRSPENRVPLFLADGRFPVTVADDKFPPQHMIRRNRTHAKLYRSRDNKEEAGRIWNFFWGAFSDIILRWFDGFVVTNFSGTKILVRVVIMSVINDLPALTDCTGQVSACMF